MRDFSVGIVEGQGEGSYFYEMKNFIREYRSQIIILLEPRISGNSVDDVCNKLGMKQRVRTEADGFSGGIWVLWRDETSA